MLVCVHIDRFKNISDRNYSTFSWYCHDNLQKKNTLRLSAYTLHAL